MCLTTDSFWAEHLHIWEEVHNMFTATCSLSHVFLQVRDDHVAPIYVINLLITDLIQLCCMIVFLRRDTHPLVSNIFNNIYVYIVGVSIGFMVCVALER